MRRRVVTILTLAGLLAAMLAATAPGAQGAECEPRPSCFDLESVSASLSSTQAGVPATQAGAHPDLTLSFRLTQDPGTPPNAYGLHEPYAFFRDLRIETPPGFLGDPNALGTPQQCTMQELVGEQECPNGSQIGRSTVFLYKPLDYPVVEPLYMMTPPGGDAVARIGFLAGGTPALVDITVRSQKQDDFGISFDIGDVSPAVSVVGVETTTWGVPTAPVHDDERCTPFEALGGCTVSPKRPPGSRPLSFTTNPTRCGVPLSIAVSANSWAEPNRVVTKSADFPQITGCDKVPFNPSLFVEPTSHRAAAPTGLELSFRLPAPEGVGVLESSHLKDMRINLPRGMGINTSAAAGLATCSSEEVHFGENVASDCPDAAKLGEVELDVPALPRRMKGALYEREPEAGHLFRLWFVADDLGTHIKLPAELEVDESTGELRTAVLDLPQAPLREVRLVLKSGFRAPLVNPSACGTYQTHWEFTPWARPDEPIGGDTPMTVDEGCGTGGFSPRLSAGSASPAAGQHAPFVFALTREDGEQNPASLDVSLPPGLVATFAGMPRCEGAASETGACPAGSQIGRVLAATGAGPTPLWTPEPGKRPTAVYLGGPYKGAPLSAIAVVPAQAGPFDLGDVVVRSAVFVDPETALVTVRSDPLPQLIQGVPILYRVTEVILDRPNFSLNPTNCSPMSVNAAVSSTQGAVAKPSAYFQASGCRRLSFKPSLSFRLFGATHRGGHPRLKAVLKMPAGGANVAAASVALPSSEFIDQGSFNNVCTRVQFAADQCPAGSIYGHVVAKSPLFDETLEGPVYLRSSSHNLPDTVAVLEGPPSLPIEVDVAGRVDSVNGGIRNSFEAIPDAPVSSFVLTLVGGPRKGLFENSENLCTSTNRATAKFTGQNGKKIALHPVVRASCGKAHRHR
jgi:hypothetical protein